MPSPWIDTHCHLDAPAFAADRLAVRAAARAAGVGHCVLVAVERSNWQAVRDLAHATGDSYALGITAVYPQAQESDIAALRPSWSSGRVTRSWWRWARLGWIFFVPALTTPAARAPASMVLCAAGAFGAGAGAAGNRACAPKQRCALEKYCGLRLLLAALHMLLMAVFSKLQAFTALALNWAWVGP